MVEGGGSPNGYATMEELRSALEKFRATGKKVIAYDVTLSEREYYLSSLADEIIVNPMGTMELNGLNSKQMFFKGALEKYREQLLAEEGVSKLLAAIALRKYSANSEKTKTLRRSYFGLIVLVVAPLLRK